MGSFEFAIGRISGENSRRPLFDKNTEDSNVAKGAYYNRRKECSYAEEEEEVVVRRPENSSRYKTLYMK